MQQALRFSFCPFEAEIGRIGNLGTFGSGYAECRALTCRGSAVAVIPTVARFRNGTVALVLNLIAAGRSRVAGTVVFFGFLRARVVVADGNAAVLNVRR
ncbi:hypothetical protein V6N13_081508 [Hibiscus sabdariffa]